jgi:hypothetical protein
MHFEDLDSAAKILSFRYHRVTRSGWNDLESVGRDRPMPMAMIGPQSYTLDTLNADFALPAASTDSRTDAG